MMSTWECQACTFINSTETAPYRCDMCSTPVGVPSVRKTLSQNKIKTESVHKDTTDFKANNGDENIQLWEKSSDTNITAKSDGAERQVKDLDAAMHFNQVESGDEDKGVKKEVEGISNGGSEGKDKENVSSPSKSLDLLSQFAFTRRSRSNEGTNQISGFERAKNNAVGKRFMHSKKESNKKKQKKEPKTRDTEDEFGAIVPAPAHVVDKWCKLCSANEGALLRYQILVAIQMSTQAQPSVVQAALQKVEANYGQITPESVQNIEYENLKDTINNVHRNKQKAKFIKEGACILLDKFNGCMPTDKKDLMAFPGIGPELGALLAALFAAGVGS
eukprot:m.186320 g.186320  ORF g.186320 m.186320 type:complete len:332 (+) comp15590_c0_seq7:387-1382(+)